ncbi:hypothetical protein OH77DRAFT_1460074 [Trametes cingulata]|nr:hypothetical protein OH77DRAFT_1460074 [Trametes cingulata]
MDSQSPSCVYNAPMALGEDLSHTTGLAPGYAGVRNRRHVLSSKDWTIGPMPVVQFMDAFIAPVEDHTKRLPDLAAFKSVPTAAANATHIATPLLAALNKHTKEKSRCPGFVFEDTYARSIHPYLAGFAKPRICCFAEKNISFLKSAHHRSRVELGYAELLVDITESPDLDMFSDPPAGMDYRVRSFHDFVARHGQDTRRDKAWKAFGSHVAFATEVLARQYRMFLFSVSISGSRARLFRWDRGGCVVTEAFDVHEHPEYLCEFLFRFSQQPEDSGRGHDPTVEPATREEEALFRDAIRQHVCAQLEVDGEDLEEALKQHYEPGQTAIVHVYHQCEGHGDDIFRFVVSRPVVSPLSLSGRGTRGYWAVNTADGEVVFLKDTWRIRTSMDPEGVILSHLNGLGVRNVPVLVMHGNVPDTMPRGTRQLARKVFQSSLTHWFASAPWVCKVAGNTVHIRTFIHYRVVVSTVGYSLTNIRGTAELLHATYDAFTAMRDALFKDSRIHRDVSVGNIILVKEPGSDIRRGYLIDWEASDTVDQAGQSRFPGRAGTWRFMSYRLLHREHADSPQMFEDDVESLVHVVLYCGVRYLAHRLSAIGLADFIRDYFDFAIEWEPGLKHGGTGKHVHFVDRLLFDRVQFRSAALSDWLRSMMEFQCPPPERRDELQGKWSDPEQIDAFWSTFLQARRLEDNDRFVHEVSGGDYLDTGYLDRSSDVSEESVRGKRAFHGSDTPEVPAVVAAKRMRFVSMDDAPLDSAADCARPPQVPTSTGPRRSLRIAERAAARAALQATT